jgi:hypothetical protein
MSQNADESSFDWLTARSECTALKMFIHLQDDVEKDLAIAKSVFSDNREKKFTLKKDADRFSVYEEAIPPRRISFILGGTNTEISVEDEKGKKKFTATLTLNKDKKCMFVVNGEELESWQLRRKALESLFFSPRPSRD